VLTKVRNVAERKTLLVFGALNLGREIARHFADGGFSGRDWSVAVVSRTRETLDDLVEEFGRAKLPEPLVLPADVADEESVLAAVRKVKEVFGSIDLAVNAVNSAVDSRTNTVKGFGPGGLLEADGGRFASQLAAGAGGTFNFLRVVGAQMAQDGRGTLVQVSATSALRAKPGFVTNAAGAFAARALTQGAAKELRGKGVHAAFLVCDGVIDSEKTRDFVGRVGKEASLPQEEVARAVEYLEGQSKRAWTHEMVLMPSETEWTI